ncbi:Protein CBG00662 [Caenorhabditis briggsae]|uniref:Uncharacterized protein n=3 Tax=Caenorhabditis briggsae TaxID=6238 RepID=A0AAE9DHE4_CAEBR|nr:Protein CBG00662 [Caenorhabditis briggsae]ULU04454.1 hypothetical protein L3Y34_017313 [Caenorhabditis briggsae]CAP21978.1 Protein CBG00662 [Caenorhabditis briggsae]
MSFTLLLLVFSIPMFSGLELRTKRSVAPFLGSGGSTSNAMLIPYNNWHCGSEGISRNFSYGVVQKDCPTLAAALNHCCAIHDDCYGRQDGQEKCDEEFCECNRMVTRLPTEEGYKCRAAMNDACRILRIVGMFAYGSSDYTDPTKPAGNEELVPQTVPSIDYDHLYSNCPHVNITLASCSLNFDLCTSVHSIDFCANDLCHCMMDAAESDKLHQHCLPAVAHSCRGILNYSSKVLAERKSAKIFMILALVVVAVVSIGFGVYYMYSKSNNERNKTTDEGKYLQIHTVESARSVNPLLTNAD